ncbi:transposase [Cylindrospermum sp. FACHB-282]|uniref:transposase n=1 Tax=Cylindrospermum sp. FACHB-282 TaxID=2692794 RepID=UPI0016888946|nr:transposase [Cylindrospermum sp. FACHB-282]MBD2387423.1 transposase [Cylindrospermum sp. FACHB-282]
MTNTQTWYIVKHSAGNCEIIPSKQLEDDKPEIIEQWGPFPNQGEAIARRVGLIRAGKCQPQ